MGNICLHLFLPRDTNKICRILRFLEIPTTKCSKLKIPSYNKSIPEKSNCLKIFLINSIHSFYDKSTHKRFDSHQKRTDSGYKIIKTDYIKERAFAV